MSDLIFDKYEILERIARGGMGEVYLARQQVAGLNRLVILKNLLSNLVDQPGFVDQFMNEARVTASLNHPNIISIFEVGAWNNSYYIALEYIDGVDLAQLQKSARANESKLPLEIILKVVHDAALGLHYAHTAVGADGVPLNVVHRDVSPHNLMVRRDGVVKVVDFGIAKTTTQSKLTQTGMLKGKLQYMAPEQVKGGTLDGRADIYSLGIVIWELIAQRPLFRGSSEFNTLQRVLRQPIPKLGSFAPGISPRLEELVSSMLRRDRDARIDSCRKVAAELRRVLDESKDDVDEQDVASFVENLVGDELTTRTQGASVVDDFVIELSSGELNLGTKENTPLTRQVTHEALSTKRRGSLIAAALAVVLLIGIFSIWKWTGSNPDNAPTIEEAKDATLTLETQPPGADVTLGETSKGKTPVTLTVPSDTPSLLRVELEGYETREQRIVFDPGDKVSWHWELVASAAPAPVAEATTNPQKARTRSKRKVRKRRTKARPSKLAEDSEGFLSVSVSPWATVHIDGKVVGETPIYKHRLHTGEHSIRLVNKSIGLDTRRTVVIKDGKTNKIVLH